MAIDWCKFVKIDELYNFIINFLLHSLATVFIINNKIENKEKKILLINPNISTGMLQSSSGA